jgi:acetyl esterase/lipase
MSRIRFRAAHGLILLAAFTLAACGETLDSTAPVAASAESSKLLPEDATMSVTASLDASLDASNAVVTAGATYVNLPYATRYPIQKLDLYMPMTGVPPYPVVIWIHGGGWRTGDKGLASGAAQLQLLKLGIALASVNYRLSTQAKFPAQIHDLKAVVRWLRANATKYKLNGARIGAWGSSAGGHLAALLGTSAGVPALTDLSLGNAGQPDNINAVVDFSGPINFLTLDTQLKKLGCPPYAGTGHNAPTSPPSQLVGAAIQTVPTKVAAANPETYVTPNDPFFLIQHGAADCLVPYGQSTNLRSRLIATLGAGKVTFQLIAGAGHTNLPFFSTANTTFVTNWLKSRL